MAWQYAITKYKEMKVAIIIPCYNEADRLDVSKFTEYLLQNTHVHFYFIDDGSTDNTISIINGIISNKSKFTRYNYGVS